MPFKDPKAKAEATKMSAIRSRLKSGKRVTQMDRAKLDAYDTARRRDKPKRPPRGPQDQARAAGGVSSPDGSTTGKVTVQSSLPGDGERAAKEGPPPLDLGSAPASDAGDPSTRTAPGPGSTASETAGNASSSAGPAGTSSKKKGPALSPEEAEMGAEAIASMSTQILSEFNAYNIANGAGGVTPEFLKMFHFSVKRLSMKYAISIDEDTHDAVVIVGTSGWVGYNSWLVYRSKKFGPQTPEKPATAAQPKQEVPTNGPDISSTVQPGPGSAPNGSGIRTGQEGTGYARPQLPRKSRPDFDPNGAF